MRAALVRGLNGSQTFNVCLSFTDITASSPTKLRSQLFYPHLVLTVKLETTAKYSEVRSLVSRDAGSVYHLTGRQLQWLSIL